jgi:hypothetical protein
MTPQPSDLDKARYLGARPCDRVQAEVSLSSPMRRCAICILPAPEGETGALAAFGTQRDRILGAAEKAHRRSAPATSESLVTGLSCGLPSMRLSPLDTRSRIPASRTRSPRRVVAALL